MLQIFWLVLAGISALLILLNQPAHARNILSEWTVEQALPYLPMNFREDYFAIYFLVLRYLSLLMCWTAAGIILSQRPDHLPATITSAALLFAPLAFGLAGDLPNAVYPAPWASVLKTTAAILSVCGMICFLLTLQIFPDGKFHPSWMKFFLIGLAAVIGVDFWITIKETDFSQDLGWLVFIICLIAAVMASAINQARRIQVEKDATKRRQALPFLLISLALLLWIVLSSSGLNFQSRWASMLNLHFQVAMVFALAIAVLFPIRRDQLWGVQWSPGPILWSIFLPITIVLLGWWVGRPILQQSQLNANREVVVTDIPAEPRIPLIFDTDLAQDDYLALLYLLQHPAVDLKAVTVSGTGEAHCNPGVGHVLAVLDLVGAAEIPVTCGRETPLAGTHTFPSEWRAGVDSFFGIELPISQRQPAALSAPDLMANLLANSPEPLTILAVGPLTNLGELFQNHPKIGNKIGHIYIMGGAVSTNGNVWLEETQYAFAEWNIYIDPVAANLVLQSGTPVTLVPLEATNFVPVERSFKRRLAKDASTPAARLANQLMATLSPEAGPFYFWDTLTAAIVTDTSLGYYREAPIKVIEEEGPDSGRTRINIAGVPVRYAIGAGRERFEGLLLAVLNQP